MATDSLLPLFHERSAESMAVPSSEPDDVLAELLGGAGEDLLASLLEPGSNYVNEMSSPPLPTTFSTSYSDLGLPDNNTSYNQDGHLGDASSYVGANTPCTPQSYSSASPVEILGNSPESGSPGDAMMMSSNVIPTDELGVLLGSITSVSSGESSADVRIDVDLGLTGRGVEEAASGVTAGQSSSGRKAATLVLTEEEKRLLSAEGVELPTDMPLTKTEQKHLKRVRRKIKNKLSAQESRRKKKEYVEGLEERVETCTNTNNQLRHRVQTLETENKTLLQQLQKLQSVVAQLYPGKLQAGSLLMVLSLCFSLLIWPHPPTTPISSSYSVTVHSRSLLFTETDEFGNIIDAESGAIVSEQGGLSPTLPYPWSDQTPAFIYPTTSHTPREL